MCLSLSQFSITPVGDESVKRLTLELFQDTLKRGKDNSVGCSKGVEGFGVRRRKYVLNHWLFWSELKEL